MEEQTMNEAIRQYLAEIGGKGGKATGKSKLRGGKDYYRQMAVKSAAVRRRKARADEKGGKQ
jgi:hypothetical protein